MVESAGRVTVAAVQMCSSAQVGDNLRAAAELLHQAADRGARLAVLPENFAFMGRHDAERLAIAEPDGDGPVQSWLAEIARDTGLWVVGGTLPLLADADAFTSSCLVFDASGRRQARYDKIHLFDVSIPGGIETYRESDNTRAGATTVVCDSPAGRLGLAVCYDLRFPEQFRQLLDDGMQVLVLPAAFTRPTGEAHWQLLLRARAVENLCPVIAAAQGGRHPGGRQTWGHSMIIDAWGSVLAEADQAPGLVIADLDMAATGRIRAAFPALEHRRLGGSGRDSGRMRHS